VIDIGLAQIRKLPVVDTGSDIHPPNFGSERGAERVDFETAAEFYHGEDTTLPFLGFQIAPSHRRMISAAVRHRSKNGL